MDTTVSIDAAGRDNDKVKAAVDTAFRSLQSVADETDRYKNATAHGLYQLNAHAGQGPFLVGQHLFNLAQMAKEQSFNEFDATLVPLIDLWRQHGAAKTVPSKDEIDARLLLTGKDKFSIDQHGQTITLSAGAGLDLGAIAKGYITDEVKELLVEEGVTTAIIDLGGNVYVLGGSPLREGESWNVGIQDPLAARGETIGKTKQKDRSIVTSGIYERYIEVDGVSYHHLMDPETGYPFDNDIAGVSILSDKSIDGDALSTLVFGLGMEAGLAYVNERDDIEAVFVTKDKKVYVSDGLTDNFELTNDDYVWENE